MIGYSTKPTTQSYSVHGSARYRNASTGLADRPSPMSSAPYSISAANVATTKMVTGMNSVSLSSTENARDAMNDTITNKNA